jgi:hypothetical protein
MSDSVEFCEVNTDENAEFLMPGKSTRLYLVLFCAPGAPTIQKAKDLVTQIEVPDDLAFVHLDPSGAPETTRWFGLSEQVGMAAIYDGAMLAVEYECSLDAFGRLLATARQQHSRLQELG